MATDDDWRLCSQDKYLKGAKLRGKQYTWQPDWNPDWDHDHCQFCWAKFMDTDLPDVLRSGYTNTEQNVNGTIWREGARWICSQCFEDFRERFGWTLVTEEPQAL